MGILLTQYEKDTTKFSSAAVNRKAERKIGFNKQSIKSPQQEIIIWAIVHFVKILDCINTYQGILLCLWFPFSAMSTLIRYKVVVQAGEIHNCVGFLRNSCVVDAYSGTSLFWLKLEQLAKIESVLKEVCECQQKWFTKIVQ